MSSVSLFEQHENGTQNILGVHMKQLDGGLCSLAPVFGCSPLLVVKIVSF